MHEQVEQQEKFTLSRTFKAPRALVWKAFTEAEHLGKWWGPKGMAIHVATFDFRPGGQFHYSMTAPDGASMWGKFLYREIVPQERVVFVNCFSDPQGNIAAPPFPGDFPKEILNHWTFTETGGQTTLSLSGGPLNATPKEQAFYRGMFSSMQQGFGGTFDQLAEYLPKL